ncbi:hypothetical protein VC836_23160, partial [Citrobacter portucalensis]|nr:hypothetical protein [Citrobacter portucalensis]
MKKRLNEILNIQISRRETVTTAAKIGSAVVLSNAISVPFSSSALAAPEAATINGTVAKLAMRQPFVLFKGLTFQKLCLP